MATGSHFLPRTQSFSHWSSWGQTLPQTAGRQFVSLIFRAAPMKSPSATSWIKAGMSMSTGHPDTQPGFLHWMQRLASSMAVSGEYPVGTSSKLVTRTLGSCSGIPCRGIRSFFSFFSVFSGSVIFPAPAAFFRFLFLVDVHPEPAHQQAEIHLVAVELGAVDAGELGLSTYGDTAGPAHPRAVHHDGVEAHERLDVVRTGHVGDHPHHRHGSDREYPVDLLTRVNEILEHIADETVSTVTAIVSRDVKLVTHTPGLLLEDEQILRPRPDNRNNPRPLFLERLGNGVKDSDAHPAADADRRFDS